LAAAFAVAGIAFDSHAKKIRIFLVALPPGRLPFAANEDTGNAKVLCGQLGEWSGGGQLPGQAELTG